jgi:hypothetical protein
MSKFSIAFLALTVVSSVAGAATQGTLGATSTGTFTNTFTGAARQVQVLDLKDALMTPDSGVVSNAVVTAGKGVTDRFCVVDTHGGAVKLTLSGNHGKASVSAYYAKSAAGDTISFNQSLMIENGARSATNLESSGFTVPAANTVMSASACGAGNVMKSINLPNGLPVVPGSAPSTAVMTLLATPV